MYISKIKYCVQLANTCLKHFVAVKIKYQQKTTVGTRAILPGIVEQKSATNREIRAQTTLYNIFKIRLPIELLSIEGMTVYDVLIKR